MTQNNSAAAGNGSAKVVSWMQERLVLVLLGILISLGSFNLLQAYQNGKAIASLTAAAVARDTRLNGIEGRLDRHLDKVTRTTE